MHVNTELISIAVVFLTALGCGLIAIRLKLPSIVGYIFAGIILGPSLLGIVADRTNVAFVAELGVLLLLYTIGMHLSLRGFLLVWKIATGTALLQVFGAVGIMLMLGYFLSWSIGVSVLLGFVLAVSSTVVAIRILEDLNLLRTQVGQIAVAILIAQDLAIIPMILIIEMMVGNSISAWDVLRIVLSALFLGILCWHLSRRPKIQLPFVQVLAKQVELRALYGVGLCFGAALITGLLELSPAYGAFLAGLVVGNSNARNVMLSSVRPIQNILMMVFFVSIGLLVDLSYIWTNIGLVLTIVFIVTVLKTLFNISVLRVLGEPWPHAFIAGLVVSQIGEFSFLLGETGFDVGLISAEEKNLIVAITVITLIISPLWLMIARRMVRIAFTNARTLQNILVRLKEGGIPSFFEASKKAAPSDRAAAIYFGRASADRKRGVIAKQTAEHEDGNKKGG